MSPKEPKADKGKKHKRSWLARCSRRFQRHLRRQLHRYAVLALIALLGYSGLKWAGEWEASRLEFNRVELPASALPGAGGLRIAFLSDVHLNAGLMEECVKQIEAEKPDLIIFGGDLSMAHTRFMRSRWAVLAFRRLVAVAPTFAVLGNHDYEKQDEVMRVYETAGVRLLRNERAFFLTPAGKTIIIAGLGDWNEGDEAPERCLAPQGSEEPCGVLLISHDPESRHLLGGYRWDLMLAGHTHAGQLGNPFTGKPISFRSDMPAGLFDWEAGRRILVTPGVGAILGMRFFCRPGMEFIDIEANSE